MKDAASKGLLLDRDVPKSHRLRRQGGREACRTGPHDQHIEHPSAAPALAGDSLDGLATLYQRIANEPHAAQLPGDVDTRNIRLELRRQHGNVDAPPLGPVHQRYRIDRTGGPAGSVADALARRDELRLSVDQPQHMRFRCLRTRLHALPAAHAARGIYQRMQRHRLHESSAARVLACHAALRGDGAPLAQIPLPQEKQRSQINDPEPI